MADLAERVEREHGALGVLVNNAGVGMSGGFGDMSLDDWEWIRSINPAGVLNGCHAFARAMIDAGRGQRLNMNPGLGYLPRASEVAYRTPKAAVLMFSRSLRNRKGVGWGK